MVVKTVNEPPLFTSFRLWKLCQRANYGARAALLYKTALTVVFAFSAQNFKFLVFLLFFESIYF
jgi:hypothetical protein